MSMNCNATAQSLCEAAPPVRGGARAAEAAAFARQVARHCADYRQPVTRRALMQLANTGVPYLAVCAIMLLAAAYEYWPITLALGVLAGGLLVRLFIIQHDCGHGSFLPSRTANDWIGWAVSVLTITPYESWKRAHALHHASSGDLSRRGTGDMLTLTVREYLDLTRWQKLRYRIYRNPLFLIVLGSPVNFLILQRLPFGMGIPWRAAWKDVLALDAALLGLFGGLTYFVGIGPVLLTALPTICIAAWIGGWLFYVQHQFEGVAWDSPDEWDLHRAALEGSSYYVLPRVLQWFTGNVGLHHVHHLNSRVPNYRLQECLDDHATLGQVGRLTLRQSFACVRMSLWDEDKRTLIGFSELRSPSHGF